MPYLAFKIGGQNYGLHHCGGFYGVYIHVNLINHYGAMLETMNVVCLKTTWNLCVELYYRSLDLEIVVALGKVYPQYWLCEEISTNNFFPHLDKIKVAFCVDKKTRGRGGGYGS